ncbi:hypothetical protein GCM10009776_12740 [Microbacterium deminutum]|uniref:Uncharacterized protein n=1 Tax=Microbacterium deminutum TaxID=344164 RepID=A0ABP5BTJ9_9MICO
MALRALIHTIVVQLADIDRGVYDDFALRVTRHPSETDAFMVTRVLAYCRSSRRGSRSAKGSLRPKSPRCSCAISPAGSPHGSRPARPMASGCTTAASWPTAPRCKPSIDGRLVYVQAGAAGVVDGYRIGPAGSLTRIGSVTVPGAAGGEGIVAT